MRAPEHATAEQIANTMALIEEAYRIRRGTHKKPFDGFTEMRHREAYRKCIFRLSQVTNHNQRAQISALAMARQTIKERQMGGKRVKKNTEIKNGMWVIFSTNTTARKDWWEYNLYQRTPETFDCRELVNHTADNEDTTEEEDGWFESGNIQQDIALEWLSRASIKRPATPSRSIGSSRRSSTQSPTNDQKIRPTSKNHDADPTIIADAMALTEIAYVIASKQKRELNILKDIQTCYQKLRFLFGEADQTILHQAQVKHQETYQVMMQNPPASHDVELTAFNEEAERASRAVFGNEEWGNPRSRYQQTKLRMDWQAYNDHRMDSDVWKAAQQIAIQTVQCEHMIAGENNHASPESRAKERIIEQQQKTVAENGPNLRDDIMLAQLTEAYRLRYPEGVVTNWVDIAEMDPNELVIIRQGSPVADTASPVINTESEKDQRHVTQNRNKGLLFLAVLAAAALAVILVFGFPVLTPIAGLSLGAWKALCVLSFAAAPIGIRFFAYTMATPSHQMPGRQIGRVALTVLSVILSTAFLIFAIPMLLAPLGAKAALATYTHLQHVAIGAGMIDAVLATGAGVMLYAFGKHEKGHEKEPIHRVRTDSTEGSAAIPEPDQRTTVGGFHDGCNQIQEDSNDDDPFDSERLPEPLIS